MGRACTHEDATAHSDIDELGDRIAEVAARLDMVTHELLTLIRELDATGGWARAGALSCAHFLSWRIGMGLGAAREKVRVAAALGELPLMDAALGCGQVSYSKVRAMTRVAAPSNEAELLELARSATAAQMEKICRLYRQTLSLAPDEAREQDRDRWVEVRATDDGMVRLTVQLLPEEAETVLAAIDAAPQKGAAVSREGAQMDREGAQMDGEGAGVERRGARVDRLVAWAEASLTGGAARSATEVVVHVSAETLTGRLAETGVGISAETSRRLCCDAGLVPVIEDEYGNTLDVGRKTRSVSAALRRALMLRDDGCQFPGCTNRRVDAHHIHHWIDGGATKLDNLLSLCRRHHRFVHEAGFAVEGDGQTPVFRDPAGRVLVDAPPRPVPAWPGFAQPCAGMAATSQCGRPVPLWDGRAPDYEWIVYGLAAAT